MKKKDFSWSFFKRIRKLKFITSMHIWLILTPLLANMFQHVNREIHINLLIKKYTIILNLGLPFSWSILYFSSLFFTIANIIFIYFCPDFILENDDFSDFKQAGKAITQLPIDMENGEPAFVKESEKDDYFKKCFWYNYDMFNYKHESLRILLLVLYAIAIILIVIVFYQNLVTVLKIISR